MADRYREAPRRFARVEFSDADSNQDIEDKLNDAWVGAPCEVFAVARWDSTGYPAVVHWDNGAFAGDLYGTTFWIENTDAVVGVTSMSPANISPNVEVPLEADI